MAISTKVKGAPTWMARPRKGSQYWLGMSGGAKGWCIYSRSEGFYLKETGAGAINRSTTRLEIPKKFGPFPSFEAAKAAFTIMHDID